jgi:hypothetical protein
MLTCNLRVFIIGLENHPVKRYTGISYSGASIVSRLMIVIYITKLCHNFSWIFTWWSKDWSAGELNVLWWKIVKKTLIAAAPINYCYSFFTMSSWY